jgi:hypothetical protein
MKTQPICLAMAIVLSCSCASAQWELVTGPYGDNVTCFAVSGANLFAGTWSFGENGGGVFLSTNNGSSWTAMNSGLTFKDVAALAVSPKGASGTNLFAVSSKPYEGNHVFLSTNNGLSWTEVSRIRLRVGTEIPEYSYPSVHCLAVSGMNLFAGTRGVFLSKDNGSTWNAAREGLPKINPSEYDAITCLSWVEESLFAGTDENGVYVSTNNGSSWTAAHHGLPKDPWDSSRYTPIGCLVSSQQNLFAGTSYGGVFLSTNKGTAWSAVNEGLPKDPNDTTRYSSVSSLASSGENLYAGVFLGGVFLSTNNGTTWTEVNRGLTNKSVLALVASGTSLLAGTCGDDNSLGGVFLSTNTGGNWVAASTHLSRIVVTAFAASGTNLFAGSKCGDGVFRSTDNGTTWNPVNAGLPNTAVYSLLVRSPNLFAGTDSGVFLSSNNGSSWAATGLLSPPVYALAGLGTNLFAGTFGEGVFLSPNNGTTWTVVDSGLTNRCVYALAVSDTELFAGTLGGVFISTNNGACWTLVDGGLARSAVYSLLVSGPDLFAGTYSGLYLSSNNGTSWTAAGLANFPISALVGADTNLFAATYAGGLSMSTDNGTSWTDASAGTGECVVLALTISGANLFAGTWEGIYRRPLSGMVTSVEPVTRELPHEFVLQQNYPNPFNPTTVVSSQLPVASNVKLAIYDLLGREVAVLVHEKRAAGSYQDGFDGSGLASGVYVYRLTAGAFVQAKSMLLLK